MTRYPLCNCPVEDGLLRKLVEKLLAIEEARRSLQTVLAQGNLLSSREAPDRVRRRKPLARHEKGAMPERVDLPILDARLLEPSPWPVERREQTNGAEPHAARLGDERHGQNACLVWRDPRRREDRKQGFEASQQLVSHE